MAEWTQEDIDFGLCKRKEGLTDGEIALMLGRTSDAVRIKLNRVAKRSIIEYPEIPSENLTVEEILDRRCEDYSRKARHEESVKLIEVKVNSNKPIGIAHIGDPHLDDDGCNLPKLREDLKLISDTDGMFAASAGDMHNNWVGRLARLYSEQRTKPEEASLLIEWMLDQVEWLYIIGGNHDVWSGKDDPVKFFCLQKGVHYEWHGVRIGLRFPNGKLVVINGRHDFPGSSQWNVTHGGTKAAKLGYGDDIYVNGHRHTSGHQAFPLVDKVCHVIQVAGYKRYDSYAKEKGFQPTIPYMESAVTIIDPTAEPSGLVKFFAEIKDGCDYLNYLRASKAA